MPVSETEAVCKALIDTVVVTVGSNCVTWQTKSFWEETQCLTDQGSPTTGSSFYLQKEEQESPALVLKIGLISNILKMNIIVFLLTSSK